ncbi:MAG: hypothetical protein Q8L85_03690 [Alphaproteobacteria bacterium]|nr:hypothetical protein [Alphaproteobacteria bacterium]
MFKKLAIYTIILFSYVSPSFSLTDEEIAAADSAAYKFIENLETTLAPEHAWTLAQMLDFFSDEDRNDAHLIMSNFYLSALESGAPCNFNEAFVKLALAASKMAQDNINRRPCTKTALTQFIADNNQLVQFISTK